MSAPRAAQRARRAARLRRKRQRGAALVMVMAVITVLTLFLTDLSQNTATDVSAALAERDALRAEYHARSGVNLARLLIATEPTIRTAIAPFFMLFMQGKKPPQIPVWEFADKILGVFNGGSGQADFAAYSKLDTTTGKNLGLGAKERFELRIVDEDSKVNLNLASRGDTVSSLRASQQILGVLAGPQYDPLFQAPDADGQTSDRQTICAAIIDWVDWDEQLYVCDPFNLTPQGGGAEDNFYQSIGLPYMRKNGGFDSLEELRLIRGVGDDFWATFVEPEPGRPDKRVVTVWGQGAVNVNTANAQTLLSITCAYAPEALLCTDPVQMAAFLTGVNLARTFTKGIPLFATGQDFIQTMGGQGMIGPLLSSLGVQPVVFKNPKDAGRAVTTGSKVFGIYSEGVVEGRKTETRVRISAVVDFRSATPLSQLQVIDPNNPQAAPQPVDPATLTPADILAAMNQNPAGTVLYWRVE